MASTTTSSHQPKLYPSMSHQAAQAQLPRRNTNQKTVVNEAQSSLSSSIHMLKRRRPDTSESDSDSFDEDAEEYGDESMNQKISNVSGIVAPQVYQQKKKRLSIFHKKMRNVRKREPEGGRINISEWQKFEFKDKLRGNQLLIVKHLKVV